MSTKIEEFRGLFCKEHPLIGVVHLKPLPGSPLFSDLEEVWDAALKDAEALKRGGVSGLVIENYGDRPFSKDSVPPQVVAIMSVIACEIRERLKLPVGINMLRNDPRSALSVALASGAQFIRVNIHIGAYITDQGLIEGKAFDTLRFRREIDAKEIKIFADVAVKHAVPFSEIELDQEVEEVTKRGLADAVIVTGRTTGAEADPEIVKSLKSKFPEIPLIVGSGITPKNIKKFLPAADLFIVGSYFRGGDLDRPVSHEKVRELVEVLKQAISEIGEVKG